MADSLRENLAPFAAQFAVHPNVVGYTASALRSLPDSDAEMWANLMRDAIPLIRPAPDLLRRRLQSSQVSAWSAIDSLEIFPTLHDPKKRPRRKVTESWKAYAKNGTDFLGKAEEVQMLLQPDENAKSVASNAVLAAIAYRDALTVQRGGVLKSDRHEALPDLIKHLLGKDADSTQVERLRRILSRKNEAHYGGTIWSQDDAEDYLEQVRRFAGWAKIVLRTYDPS